MKLDEFAAQKSAQLAERVSAKVLTIDIETSPTVVYTFDMKPNWISPEKIIEPSQVMCFAAKWYGDDSVQFFSNHHHGHEKVVKKAWKLLDEADAVVTFNGVRFDHKHLNREFALAGYPEPRPYKQIDLYRTARTKLEIESKSLNHLAQRFELGAKVEHEGFGLWRDCLAGDRAAWERMKSYNIQDVWLTEALYDRMRGWINNHPHLGPIDAEGDGILCNQCGGDDLEVNGFRRAQVIDYRIYRCRNCGANVQQTAHGKRIANTRGVPNG